MKLDEAGQVALSHITAGGALAVLILAAGIAAVRAFL